MRPPVFCLRVIMVAKFILTRQVFEFLWADCPEFEWEWKCLGYTRFIVLRHSDSFPHYCACVYANWSLFKSPHIRSFGLTSSPPSPISTGNKRDFAKPGVDTLQQGYVYASGSGDKDRDHNGSTGSTDSPRHQSSKTSLPELAYSSVGISLKSGRHRVKDDSRANYADVVEVDHEAQVMVIGDAARYFDRIRKNVNKAYMRQVLREALGPYCQRKKSESAAAGVKGWGNSAVSLTKVSGEDKEPAEAEADHVREEETTELRDKRPEHAQSEHVRQENVRSELVRSEHVRSEHVQSEPVRPEHVRREHRRPELIRPEYVHIPESPAATERDLEDFFSDTTRDEEDWEGSPRSPAYFPHPSPPQPSPPQTSSDERRARRAASRARASPVIPEHTTGVRPGMDKAGLSSLRTLRQGLPGGDEHDDTQSLRSLAMVGRSDSYTSSRSRR